MIGSTGKSRKTNRLKLAIPVAVVLAFMTVAAPSAQALYTISRSYSPGTMQYYGPVWCEFRDEGPYWPWSNPPRYQRNILTEISWVSPSPARPQHSQQLFYRHILEVWNGTAWVPGNQVVVNGVPLVPSADTGFLVGSEYGTWFMANGNQWNVPARWNWRVKTEYHWHALDGTLLGTATNLYSLTDYMPDYFVGAGAVEVRSWWPTRGGNSFGGWCRFP